MAVSRRLAAIMFTDMVGYSTLAERDEATALAALSDHNALLRPIFANFHGREVKTVGDAFLVEFESAQEATLCALAIQEALEARSARSTGGPPVRLRIGIHVGDVVRSQGDVLGDAVNIASRVVALADPGGICVTQQVYDQIRNKVPASITPLGARTVKNLREPIAVYRVAARSSGAIPSTGLSAARSGHVVAVLPLTNISPDPGDAYFADGLTEELISVLSQVPDLGVIARTSVAPYKLAPRPISQVGAELGVDSVLEGSVRKAGSRIRIGLQLVDVATQRPVWSTRYDRELDDVFAVQADIAGRTAEALRLELAGGGSRDGRRRPTANTEAYDLYLRGLVAARNLESGGLDRAIAAFEKAIQLDPTFAEAYVAWANLYVFAVGDFLPQREAMPRGRQLAERALELDPESSDAYAALANVALQFDNNWTLAEERFRKSISLNPNNVVAYQFFGLMCIALERFDEATEAFRRTIRLDPGGARQRSLAWAELESGDYELAFRYAVENLDRTAGSASARVSLGLFYAYAGDRDGARREAEVDVSGENPTVRFDHALLCALVGKEEVARKMLAEVEAGTSGLYTCATDLAMLYAPLGEGRKALDLLEKDAREGDQVLWLYYRGPSFDSIRDDPRFVALLRQRGLPTHPIRRPLARKPPGSPPDPGAGRPPPEPTS